MTLERHRCLSGQGQAGFSPAIHHLSIYHTCTIAPSPSKTSAGAWAPLHRHPPPASLRALPPVVPHRATGLSSRHTGHCLHAGQPRRAAPAPRPHLYAPRPPPLPPAEPHWPLLSPVAPRARVASAAAGRPASQPRLLLPPAPHQPCGCHLFEHYITGLD